MITWEQMSRKEQLAATHYDFYKDVHGIRPRWMNYEAMTEQELEQELDQLSAEAEVVRAEEERQQAQAVEQFERTVFELIRSGAKDAAMAVRWLHEAHGTDGDNDYLCFHLGLPYGYIDKTVDKTAV